MEDPDHQAVREPQSAAGDAKAIWAKALPEELRFWEGIISGTSKHQNYVQNFRRRASGVDEIAPHLVEYLEGKDIDSFEILDVGAGPHSVIGSLFRGKRLRVSAIDPLADQYNELISAAQIIPAIPTVAGEAENLAAIFPGKKFDLVYSRNALDHVYDAVAALQAMVNVCAPGGVVFIEGSSNEAVKQRFAGLHQWNFMPVDGDLVIWKLDFHRSMKCHLQGYSSLRAEGTSWYKVEIIKRPAGD